jgi:hypothetical protein
MKAVARSRRSLGGSGAVAPARGPLGRADRRLGLVTDPLDELTGGARRRDPELSPQALAELRVGLQRAGPVAARDEAADELALGILGERVEQHPPAGPGQRALEVAPILGRGGEALEHAGEPAVEFVARLVGPVVVQADERVAAPEGDGVLERAVVREPLELPDVRPRALESHALARCQQRPGRGPQLAPQCP